MLDWLKARLTKPEENSAGGGTDSVRRIVDALDRLEPERARFVAAFAYILGRVAHADRETTPDETRAMERIVARHSGLPEEQAVVVVQIAKSQNRLFGATEDFLVAREFNQVASLEQKIGLVHCLFAVAATDAGISTVEDNEIARVANELKVPHEEFVRARVAFREHLNVLRPGPEAS
jgi:uncharacterized tellurite resistance protein B-like protein